MKIILFVVAFLCSTAYCKAQVDLEKALLKKLETTTSDTLKAEIYIDLHNAVFVSNPNKSYEYASSILESGKKGGSLLMIQKGYMALARCERRNRNYEAVFPLGMQSIEYARKSNNTSNLFLANLLLATDYIDGDKPTNALPYLNECEQLRKSLTDPLYSGKLNRIWGAYYDELNQNKKAIPYHRKALQIFELLKDDKLIAQAKFSIGVSYLALGETDSVTKFLYGALKIYKKTNIISRQAECYGFLGQCYIINGNIDKGIEVYLQIIELFKLSHNRVQEGLSYIDLARCYLIKKKTASAERYGKHAENTLQELKYEYGIIMTKTFWGQYYSENGAFQQAEGYFKEADKMADENQLPELKTDNERYWAQHRYKVKNNKGADSLVYSYIKHLLAIKDPSTIKKDLATLLKKNPELNAGTVKMLKLLYSPGGADSLRRKLGNKALLDIAQIDSVLNLNPYSLGTPAYDSNVILTDNGQLIEMETQYKTRLISDSLEIEKQNAIIARQDIKRRNTVLIASLAGLLLLSVGLWLQYNNRKRAEKDKAKIELLQNEIHHRVTNNLAVIRRLIDVAGKSGTDSLSLQSLQNRVSAIELLHKRLYNDEITGNISLQAYLTELTSTIQNTFETDKKIDIKVNAPIEVSSKTAEKIGLITNELVTNSYKYAFQERDEGSITIEATTGTGGNFNFKVADNGKGINGVSKNYGMKLIAGLANELNASFAFKNNNGTHFTLEFTDNI